MIGEIPNTLDWNVLRKRLVEMRETLVRLERSAVPPRPVTNLTATAKAGGVIIMFTRTDGDNYILYRNATPQLNGAVRIELGKTGLYTDDIGKSAETRYYWVVAKKGSQESSVTGPVSATTLALNVEITPPAPPPAVDEPVNDVLTGYPTER